jgi:hypothetical protein
MPVLPAYTGDEPSCSWDQSQKPKGAGLFDVRLPGVPFNAKPVYDADLDCIIGYQQEAAGVSRIYGLEAMYQLAKSRWRARPLIRSTWCLSSVESGARVFEASPAGG